MRKYKIQPGNRYGFLTSMVARPAHEPVKCLCDCGKIHMSWGSSLLAGKSTHCGCRGGEARVTDHPKYTTWANMIQRCYNKDSPSYRYYGARGVKVQESWCVNSVEFLKYIESLPGYDPSNKDLSLDRKDNNGHYEEGNLRWASRTVQANNRTSSHALRTA